MSSQTVQVKDIMTTKVLAIGPDDNLEKLAQIFEQYDYDGLPVVAPDTHKLMGIVTAYDMVLQSSGVHLPTVLNLVGKMAVNQADRREIEEQFGKLRDIKAKSIMNVKPVTIGQNVTLEDAARMFAEHHNVNPLCVVDDNGILTGVLSRYDIIRFFSEKHFKQVVAQASVKRQGDPFGEFSKTKTEREAEEAVGSLSQKFLLVTKRRPRIWKYAFVAALLAGFAAAMATIIRIVQKGG